MHDQLHLAGLVLQEDEGQVLAQRLEHADAARDAHALALQVVKVGVQFRRLVRAPEGGRIAAHARCFESRQFFAAAPR